MNLEKKDTKIILKLDYRARDSFSKIAKELKFSKDFVINRIKKLEKDGLIEGYYSVIDYYILGFKTYKLYVKLNKIDLSLEKEILNFLKKEAEVRFLSFVSNDYDLIITYNVKKEEDFFRAYREFSFKFSNFISKKDLAIVNSQHHFKQPIFDNNEKVKGEKREKNEIFSSLSRKENEIVSLNKSDIELLKIISLNAKIKFIDLARKLDKNSNSLLYALKSLEKRKIILGYRPRINFNKLGKSHYIINLNLKNMNSKNYSKLFKLISSLNGIIYISECIAHFDLEFELVSENNFEMMKEINILKENSSEYLVDLKIRNVLETFAINYTPFSQQK
ncbi:MAG: Lrp/AsnC family transcriptional regulator [Nanoarchaeota archaeon]|nr:Lrp/AsnC family transcriptional regulator [Nanoarchaeota archaeon]